MSTDVQGSGMVELVRGVIEFVVGLVLVFLLVGLFAGPMAYPSTWELLIIFGFVWAVVSFRSRRRARRQATAR